MRISPKTQKVTALILAFVVFATIVFYRQHKPATEQGWGLSFSSTYAEYLGFAWPEVYQKMLDELKPQRLRLNAYWPLIEDERGKFDFSNIDKMLLETDKRNIEVILVVGRKQPRWPECHQPDWYGALSPEDKKTAQLTMIKTAVEHFKSHKSIAMWQVENEPLFDFGPQCPRTVTSFLREQVALVKSLDSRPVLISDSGELGRWLPSARVGDILGSTMYRKIHNPKLGYIQYPLPPAFFKLKSGFVKFFTGKPIIGVELQAEPWYVTDVHQTDLVRQKELMNVDIFNDNVAYATKVGFPQNYLWGVEWWYWLGIKHGDWSMWQAAQKVLQE